MVSRIDRTNYSTILAAAQEALRSVERDFGLSISFGPSPSLAIDGGMTAKIYFKVGARSPDQHPDEVSEDRVQSPTEFAANIRYTGRSIPLEWLGQTFTASSGEEYRITGASRNRARNVRMPVQAIRVRDGARFKFSIETVRRNMPSTAPEPVLGRGPFANRNQLTFAQLTEREMLERTTAVANGTASQEEKDAFMASMSDSVKQMIEDGRAPASLDDITPLVPVEDLVVVSDSGEVDFD